MRTIVLLAASTSLLAVVTAGCAQAVDRLPVPGDAGAVRRERPLAAAEASQTSPAATRLAARRVAPAAGTPPLRYAEYRLPPGCAVTSVDERVCGVQVETGHESTPTHVALLDFETGELDTLLTRAINAAEGWDIHQPVVSEDWLVWEEVSPNEGVDPRNARWQLYAAPLAEGVEGVRARAGSPLLVDEGWTGVSLRPYYGLVGSRLVWTRNRVPGPGQDDVDPAGSVVVRDLDTGDDTELAAVRGAVETLRVAGTQAVFVTQAVSGRLGRRVDAVDVLSAERIASHDLSDVPVLSHQVEYREGEWFWAAFSSEEASWPDLYCTAADGRRWLLGTGALDPVAAGRLIVFERVVRRTGVPGTKSPEEVFQVCTFDPVRRERRTLLEVAAGEGWWQLPWAGGLKDRFVVYNDEGPWSEQAEDAATLVRVYRVE